MINNGGTPKFFNVKVRAYHDQVIAGEAIPISKANSVDQRTII
jgi:hypothetical protein